MHDLLEGVCIYDMSLILYYYIIETKQLDFDTVNYRITHFNFYFDCRNKPPPISYDHLQKKKIKMTAYEMLGFCRYFTISH
jgi:hypothetical protein